MSKHTPTPWKKKNRWDIVGADGEDVLISDGQGFGFCGYAEEMDANIDLVLESANSHDQLVEALKPVLESVPKIPEFGNDGSDGIYAVHLIGYQIEAMREALKAAGEDIS